LNDSTYEYYSNQLITPPGTSRHHPKISLLGPCE
jgi:hypothetical protein